MNRHRVEAEGLVEPEGVNAGSASSTAESAKGAPQSRPTSELLRGGRPELAGEQWPPEPDGDLAVPQWSAFDAGGPSLEQSVEEARVDHR